MNNYNSIIEAIKNAKKIVITSHKSPDGDSIGSSIAMLELCKSLGRSAQICHPDPAPEFLLWLPEASGILDFENHTAEIAAALAGADLIFALDYNDSKRLGDAMGELLVQSPAQKIMIDHHLYPSDFAEIVVSDPAVCSTSQLIYQVVEDSGNVNLITPAMGTALYLGIMTDTGSFRFSSVDSRTHLILAHLIEIGVKHYEVHENVYDTNTVDRLRLKGYACSEKLEILEKNKVAIISLTMDELNRFNYKKGDTEGLVNTALSVKGMRVAVLFTEGDGIIKISFRSKGKDNPINLLASDHFNGGGHANASGGRFDGEMEGAITLFKSVVEQYIIPA